MDKVPLKIIETANDNKFLDQVSGTIVNQINNSRIADEITRQSVQDVCFSKAIDHVDKIREFVGSPQNILGNDKTKHGEIAEQVEVGIRRAKQAFEAKDMTATFDGIGRTAPVDYLIDGVAVQSKFINGVGNNLNAIIDHMEKYPDFGRDGSYYHIPKDFYHLIEKIKNNNEVDGLKLRTIEVIKEKISKIESHSDKPFGEVVQPSISKYVEVQKGAVHERLDNYEKDFTIRNSLKKEQIVQEHQPSLAEATKVAAIAGTVGATISLTTSFYKKHKEGKRFYRGDFTFADWKEIGIITAKDGATGAISGSAIYALTNYAPLSAPFAGAIVSASKGVSSLLKDWKIDKINEEEFIELGMLICSESAIVGFATAAGQAAIPIPVLGAVIGSVAGSMFATFLGAKNKKTARAIQAEIDEYLKKLDKVSLQLVTEITAFFENIGNLTEIAFDLENNEKLLEYSVELAKAYGLPDNEIISSISELDDFMQI